jgi:hypothetical protein
LWWISGGITLRDKYKTKRQLIEELDDLRRQVAELKKAQENERGRPKRRPVRVGEILIEMGFLTQEQLEMALQKQREADMRGDSHIPVGSILAASGIIARHHLQMALAEQRRRLGH